jgi:Fe-S oxidoreductase
LQCVSDRCCPAVAVATARVREATGARVVVPPRQHCCGLPALDAGDLATARSMARQTIAALEAGGADYVVSAAASCVVAMQHEYPSLFADEPGWQRRAEALGRRVRDLTSYLTEIAGPPSAVQAGRDGSAAREAVVYHPFCQSLNVLGLPAEPRALLEDALGLELRSLPEANVCCGFGGSASFDHPAIAREIVARKLANVASTGATTLVTDNPGCLLHLRGAAHAAGGTLQVKHLAEIVAERLDAREVTVTSRADRG